MRWFNNRKLNSLHPKLFTRPPVKAVQVSLPARVFRTSDKDAAMRNDGAAVTRTWECCLPTDVIRRSPMERRFVLLSHTIPERPAELRPILCPHCQGQQQQGKHSSNLKKYLAIHVQGQAESDDSSRKCEAKRVNLSLLAGAYSTRQSSEYIRVFARIKGYRDLSRIQESCMVACDGAVVAHVMLALSFYWANINLSLGRIKRSL